VSLLDVAELFHTGYVLSRRCARAAVRGQADITRPPASAGARSGRLNDYVPHSWRPTPPA